VRDVLKKQTDPTHRRLDDAFSEINLATMAGYALFLRTHYLAYSALRSPASCDAALSKTVVEAQSHLEADLSCLGVDAANPPPRSTVPRLHAFGIHYVLAGSHFGKRVLLKRWSRSEDSRVLQAGAYLNSDILREDWKPVLGALECVTPDSTEAAEIIDSAEWTFDLFGTCLKEAARADLETASGSS